MTDRLTERQKQILMPPDYHSLEIRSDPLTDTDTAHYSFEINMLPSILNDMKLAL